MSSVVLTLPFPPSVNNLFATIGRRRVPTERYAKWKAEASLMLMAQRPGRVAGAVSVCIDLVAPDKRRRDLDNCCKAPLDALVKAGVILDDSVVRQLNVGWRDRGEPCVVTVSAHVEAAPR